MSSPWSVLSFFIFDPGLGTGGFEGRGDLEAGGDLEGTLAAGGCALATTAEGSVTGAAVVLF